MKTNFENTQNQFLSQYSQLSQGNNYNSQSSEYGENFNSQNNVFSQVNNPGCNGDVYCNDIELEISKKKALNNIVNNLNVNVNANMDKEYSTRNLSVKKEQVITQISQPYYQDNNNFSNKNIHQEVDGFYKDYSSNMMNLKTKLILSYDKLEEQTIRTIKYHKSQLVEKLSLVDKIIELEVHKIKDSNENVIIVNEKINFLFKQLLEVIKTINN